MADKGGFGNDVREITVGERTPADIELKLSKNDGVTLKIIDARTGQPLSAMVWVFDSAGRYVQDSGLRIGGGDSAADVRLALAPGQYSATVSTFDYAPQSVTITSPGTQTVALTPGGKVVLRSTRSDRQRVRLVDARGNVYPRTPSGFNHRDLQPSPATVSYDHVAPGNYAVQVLTNNDTTIERSIPVVVTERGVIDVDV
jgi:uncharacterized protein (DUF2141 family)